MAAANVMISNDATEIYRVGAYTGTGRLNFACCDALPMETTALASLHI